MGLLVEQERILAVEEYLIDDAATYTRNQNFWGTLHDYGNIVLAEPTLLAITWHRQYQSGAVGVWMNQRLKIGSFYVSGDALAIGIGTYDADRAIYVYCQAGTHNILLECINTLNTATHNNVTSLKLGKVKFTDQTGAVLDAYSSQTLNLPFRKTPVGFTKQGTININVYAATAADQTNMENVGDGALVNGVILSIDGVQVSWTERIQDDVNLGVYGAAYGRYSGALTLGADHVITVTKDNVATVVHWSIILSPWILSEAGHEPVTLSFPQFSTFYTLLEPVIVNLTKNSKIGKHRAVRFNDACDYYSLGTGASDLVAHSYLFEVVKVSGMVWTCDGFGGCISHVGVDIR